MNEGYIRYRRLYFQRKVFLILDIEHFRCIVIDQLITYKLVLFLKKDVEVDTIKNATHCYNN